MKRARSRHVPGAHPASEQTPYAHSSKARLDKGRVWYPRLTAWGLSKNEPPSAIGRPHPQSGCDARIMRSRRCQSEVSCQMTNSHLGASHWIALIAAFEEAGRGRSIEVTAS